MLLNAYDAVVEYIRAHSEDAELERLVGELGRQIDDAVDDKEQLEEYARTMQYRRGYGGGWV